MRQFSAASAQVFYGPPLVPGAVPILGGPPAAVPATGQVKPFGMVVLVIAVAATSAIGLWVVLDYGYWSSWNFSYDDFGSGMLDGAFALAYLATSILGFLCVPKLWSYQASGWPMANLVAAAWLTLDFAGIVVWTMTGLSLIGLVAIAGVLVYLNMNHVRAIFGRPPLIVSTTPSQG